MAILMMIIVPFLKLVFFSGFLVSLYVQMDCFKIEQETLRYIKTEQESYNNIIQTLQFLTRLTSPIFNLFPETSFIKKKYLSKKQSASYIDDEEEYKQSIDTTQQNNQINLEEGQLLLKCLIKQTIQTKQQKYMLIIDLTNIYLKIMKKQNYTLDNNLNTISTIQEQKKQKLNEIQIMYQQYINQQIVENGNDNTIPILVKLCYRLLDLHKLVQRTKDLMIIRDYCIQFKQKITSDLIKDNKYKLRKKIVHNSKPCNVGLSTQRSSKTTKKQLKKKCYFQGINNSPQTNIHQLNNQQKIDKTNIIQQQTLEIAKHFPRKPAPQKTFISTVSVLSVSPNIPAQFPNQYWQSRLDKIPDVKQYIKIFLWKIDSCLLLISEVQHRNPLSKNQLIEYIKMGQQLKQKYCQTNHEITILEQIMNSLSCILTHASKQKQCKYYEIMILQLEIVYQRLRKLQNGQLTITSNNSIKNIRNNISKSSDNKLLANNSCNINNRIAVNPKINTSINAHSNLNIASIIKNTLENNNKDKDTMEFGNGNNNQNSSKMQKIIKNVSFTLINNNPFISSNNVDNNKNEQKNKQNKKIRKNIYKFVNQQLQQIQKKNNEQIFHEYLQQQNKIELQNKIKLIQNQKKRKNQFHKSLYSLTQRQSKILTGCSFHHGKFTINTKQIIEENNNKYNSLKKYHKANNKMSSNQTVRSAYNVFQVALMMRQQQNIEKNRGSERSIRTARKAIIVNRDSFNKQISNIIFHSKRIIKPSKYFQSLKDQQNNLYREIISSQQHVTILTKQLLIKQQKNIFEILSQKAIPTFEEILILARIKDQSKNNGLEKQGYSFERIYATMTNTDHHSFQQNVSNIQNDKYQITVIQCFSQEIGFIKIRMNKNCNENQILFSSQNRGLSDQNITVVDKSSENERKTRRDDYQYKTIFSFDQLKSQIINSQFYFELVQQKLAKKIQKQDVEIVQQYLNREQYNKSNISSCSESLEPQNNQIISDKDKQSNKVESLLLLGISRISHALLNWYYTKASKINGNILIKRQIPYISDQIKFTIALQFMKKYNYKQCLERLGNVRNKVALYECLKYLLYGKKILLKGLTIFHNNFAFYTLTLEKFKDRNFEIRTKQQGGSYFKNLQFTLTLYHLQTWNIIHSYKYPIENILPKQKITLMMLSNIIQDIIPHEYLQQLVKDIQNRQLPITPQNNFDWQGKDYRVIQPPSQQKTNLVKFYIANLVQSKNNIIANFGNFIASYMSLMEGSINFSVKEIYHRIIKIQKQYMDVEELHLGCGLILQIIKNIKNKGKCQQILIFQENDLKQIVEQNRKQFSNKNKNSKQLHDKYSNLSSHRLANSDPKARNSNNYLNNQQDDRLNDYHQLSQLSQDKSKLNQENCEQKYNYKILKSPYHSRISIFHPTQPTICLTNRINKCMIEKQLLDIFQILDKKIMKVNGKFIYLCLSFIPLINSYRIDIYDPETSKKYASLFRMEEYQIETSVKSTNMLIVTNEIQPNQQSFCSDQNQYEQQNSNNIEQQKLKNFHLINQSIKSLCKIFNKSSITKNNQHNQHQKKSRFKRQLELSIEKHQIIIQLVKKNKIKINDDFKYISIDQKTLENITQVKKNKQIIIPLFEVFNNLTSLKGHNKGRIELIKINQKIILFILLQNQQNLYFNIVDDNPYMNNNANLFADCHIKDHRINLYTDLFMRVYIKFINNGFIMTEMNNLREINNL